MAAGGLLVNAEGQLLCIRRLGHWDLPKGKVEANESLEQAAAREVMEECGVPLPLVRSPFAVSHHLYGPNDGLMKTTHWFRLEESTPAKSLKPQTEEAITQVVWASPEEVAKMEPGAFSNIAQLMAAWRATR